MDIRLTRDTFLSRCGGIITDSEVHLGPTNRPQSPEPDLKRVKWEGTEVLAPGRHPVEFDFKYAGLGIGTLAFNNMSGLGRPGTGTLKVDGKGVQTITMTHTMPMILQWDESFDIGSDTLTGVNDADYKPPFTLTAKLNKLTIKVDRPTLSPEDIKKLESGQATALDDKPLTRVQPGPH
jgi:hypothetical protein